MGRVPGRPKRKRVELNTESFLGIAQEAYNELIEQRSTAIKQINENKKKVEVEDAHDLVSMNKVNTDLLKIVDSTIDKKLNILKMMSGLIHKTDSASASENNGAITPEDLEMLQSLMNGESNDDNEEYKLK